MPYNATPDKAMEIKRICASLGITKKTEPVADKRPRDPDKPRKIPEKIRKRGRRMGRISDI